MQENMENVVRLSNTVKHEILDGIIKKMITHGMIYTTYPKILFSLTKEQVMDIIEALCTEAVNRRWFNIMNSTPDVTSVGFDWFFLNRMMFGTKDKIYKNTYKPTHPLVTLFKQYYDVYQLDDWYSQMRMVWYQNLIPRSNTLVRFTQENKFVALLSNMFDFPFYYNLPTSSESLDSALLLHQTSEIPLDSLISTNTQFLPDLYFSGAVAWATGTNELVDYGRKGKNVNNPKTIRPLISSNGASSCFLPINICDKYDYAKKLMFQRKIIVFSLLEKLYDLGLIVSLNKDEFLVPWGENNITLAEITVRDFKNPVKLEDDSSKPLGYNKKAYVKL